jgi:hypothetical protein
MSHKQPTEQDFVDEEALEKEIYASIAKYPNLEEIELRTILARIALHINSKYYNTQAERAERKRNLFPYGPSQTKKEAGTT